MATPRADIDPSLLRWARESIGYSIEDAATKLKLRGGAKQLEAWEAGEGGPTVAQLRKAAQIYRRPLAVFFLPEPPRDFQAMQDFRRVPGAEAGRWSPNLHSAVIRAGDVGDLPESPQHRIWRHAREQAAVRIEGFKDQLTEAIEEA
jgi:transcriptional regulator with XRE-family HTH domain